MAVQCRWSCDTWSLGRDLLVWLFLLSESLVFWRRRDLFRVFSSTVRALLGKFLEIWSSSMRGLDGCKVSWALQGAANLGARGTFLARILVSVRRHPIRSEEPRGESLCGEAENPSSPKEHLSTSRGRCTLALWKGTEFYCPQKIFASRTHDRLYVDPGISEFLSHIKGCVICS
jgi:hypothetical protein